MMLRVHSLLLIVALLACLQAAEANDVWPLKVSPNARHLVKDNGDPFFYLCDTAWWLFTETSDSEMRVYMDNRASKGFTVVHAPILVPLLNGESFEASEVTSPDAALFNKVESYVQYARSKGLTMNLIPAWMGSNGSQWGSVFRALSDQQIDTFARYVGNRFKQYDNVIYSVGGDIGPTSRDIEIADIMAEALKEIHPDALITFFSVGGDSSRTWFENRSWFDFSFLQRKTPSDPRQYTGVIEDYEKTPVKPTHLGEFAYEYEYTGERWPLIDAFPIRRSAYLSMLSGAMGYTYGRRGLWHFNGTPSSYRVYDPWQDLLTDAKSPGAADVARMRTVLESMSWPDIVPDHAQDFGTSGDNQGSIDYTASAVATNGNYAIAYFPKTKTTGFDLSRLGGSEVVAEWYDPADGSKQVVAGSPFPRTNRNFTPPGSNSAGDDDWVLLFTANGGPPQRPSPPKNLRFVP